MANTKLQFFILTGEPGVGKTTLTKKLSSMLAEQGVKISGFYTEEVRKDRVRAGFDIVTFDGNRGLLARDTSLLNSSVKHKVGKYGVLVKEFESIALPTLKKSDGLAEESQLLVIDEIGKMEFFSDSFKMRIKELFFTASNDVVLATIPIRKSDALIENIRNHNKAKVWTVTRENRNIIHNSVLNEIKNSLNLSSLLTR